MKPVHSGPGGRSYRCKPASDLDLGTFLVHTPADKPHHLQWFAVIGVALSSQEGADAPHLTYPKAEFELSIWPVSAVANDELRELINVDADVIDTGDMHVPLAFPGIVSVQFDGIAVESARAVTEATAAAICTGRIEPKRTVAEAWRRAVRATVDHLKVGH